MRLIITVVKSGKREVGYVAFAYSIVTMHESFTIEIARESPALVVHICARSHSIALIFGIPIFTLFPT